jgi:hypothetical protein
LHSESENDIRDEDAAADPGDATDDRQASARSRRSAKSRASAHPQRPRAFSTDYGSVSAVAVVESEQYRVTQTPRRRQRFVLPWFCKYLGWLLCLLAIAGSIFCVWAYGVQFGNDLTYQWLTSTLVALFAGLLVFDPLKVYTTSTSCANCPKQSGRS